MCLELSLCKTTERTGIKRGIYGGTAVEITEVRIKLMDDPTDRLQGFCSITFDGCFVVRDLKIILGTKGPFVAMPSRKLTDRCPTCGTKNQLRARYCNDCSAELDEDRAIKDNDGRAKLYADISHPINSTCRDLIQRKVLEAFGKEKVRAKQPGYKCTYDDYGEDRIAKLKHEEEQPAPEQPNTPTSASDTTESPTPESPTPETPTTAAPTTESSDKPRMIRFDQPSAVEPPHHLQDRPDSVASEDDEFGEGVAS